MSAGEFGELQSIGSQSQTQLSMQKTKEKMDGVRGRPWQSGDTVYFYAEDNV